MMVRLINRSKNSKNNSPRNRNRTSNSDRHNKKKAYWKIHVEHGAQGPGTLVVSCPKGALGLRV